VVYPHPLAVWCNQSGGSAIGSLSTGTAISNVLYRNVYTNGGNQALMIKSNGGSGYVKDVQFQNFISRGVAYGLDINQYWSSQTPGDGAGVALSNIAFTNWDGYVVDGSRRAPIQIICADGAPCSNITLSNVYMWAENSVAHALCESAYGSGVGCLKPNSGSHTSYAGVTSSYAKPGAYSTPTTMAGDLASGFTSTAAIPTPYVLRICLLSRRVSSLVQDDPDGVLPGPGADLTARLRRAPRRRRASRRRRLRRPAAARRRAVCVCFFSLPLPRWLTFAVTQTSAIYQQCGGTGACFGSMKRRLALNRV
jgi:hypothetical protein